MFRSWTTEEILLLDQGVRSRLTTEDIYTLAEMIGRSYQATRKKILEIANIIPSSRLVKVMRRNGQLTYDETSDFPKDIDHSDKWKWDKKYMNLSYEKKILFETQEQTRLIRRISNKPVVVIGGINQKNYKKLLLNKADFLAISSFIWKNKKLKPEEAINKIK